MLPSQAGTSRCFLDFLFPLRCGRRAHLLLLSSFYPSIPLPGQQVGRVLFCLHSSGVFRRHQAAWNDLYLFIFIFFFGGWGVQNTSSHFNATFVKNSELNIFTFHTPAALVDCCVLLDFLPSRSLNNFTFTWWKRNCLVLPDQFFSCEKRRWQFHQLGVVVRTAFVK